MKMPEKITSRWLGTLDDTQLQAAEGQLHTKFAKLDKSAGLLGRGIVRFDLRVPGKMIVRLPRAPGEAIGTETQPQQQG